MTLLEYVCDNMIGPPVSRCGDRSTYHCPTHGDDHPSFSTFPHKPEYKDRFKCWSCGFRGDEFDLLREFFPHENFGQHQNRLAAFREDFERESKSKTVERHSTSSIRGGGRITPTRTQNAYDREPRDDEFSPETNETMKTLVESLHGEQNATAFREKLLLVQKALELCAQHGLHLAGLALRVGFEARTGGVDREHLAEVGIPISECDPKTCDASFCRNQRGQNEEAKR